MRRKSRRAVPGIICSETRAPNVQLAPISPSPINSIARIVRGGTINPKQGSKVAQQHAPLGRILLQGLRPAVIVNGDPIRVRLPPHALTVPRGTAAMQRLKLRALIAPWENIPSSRGLENATIAKQERTRTKTDQHYATRACSRLGIGAQLAAPFATRVHPITSSTQLPTLTLGM